MLLELRALAPELRHLGLELRDLLMLALEVVLNGRWRERPRKLGKG